MTMPNVSRPGGLNLDALLEQAKQAQQRLTEVEEQRRELRVTGNDAEGMAEAQIDGTGRVVSLYVNREPCEATRRR
jgi:DNA-binding protein YbaB